MKSIKKSKGVSKRRKRQTQKPKNKRPRKGTKAKRNVRKKTRKGGMHPLKFLSFFSQVPQNGPRPIVGEEFDGFIEVAQQPAQVMNTFAPGKWNNQTKNFYAARGTKGSFDIRNKTPHEKQVPGKLMKKKYKPHTYPWVTRGARSVQEFFPY
jgi:hypothetical protein